MGASKRIMEMVGFTRGGGRFSTARFANVAFSNGSLLRAFWDRIDQGQPLSAPSNIQRFFITHQEAARKRPSNPTRDSTARTGPGRFFGFQSESSVMCCGSKDR
jgi:hypothetical protein